MKINVKDVASGLLLLGLALVGLWINGGLFGLGWEQHSLGSARRMGPGYMPMLTFWLLGGLGTLVLVVGLFNGPDRLERWAWRELLLILAAMCVFSLLLENGGLFATIAVTVAVASLAERTHTVRSVAGLIVFLLALCWYVFIRELDIRIEIWPVFWR